ncbi:MAG TPA: hypothetical protein VIV40_28665 [Kofleriaceae bacterium]
MRSDVGLTPVARFGAGVLLAAATACSPTSPSSAVVAASGSGTPARVPRPLAAGESNIERADYVGPEACGECHAPQYAAWTTSLHRVMNANAEDPKAVIANFSGAVLRYAGGEAHFDRSLTGYVMTVRAGERETRYRITRTIGKAHLQEYVGIEEPKNPNAHGREARGNEVRLPFGWWPRYGGWAAQPFFDPWLDEAQFDAYAPVREPWAERCPWCHSTYPFAQRIARASGPRAVGHGFEQYFTSHAGSERLAVDEQVTTGISCESCHLGGRAHADGAAIDFLPHGASVRDDAPVWPATFGEQRKDASVVNGVCAQCHSGPSPRLADGTALRNSSEALDLAASSCKAKCTDCHDPHRGSIDEAKSIAACVGCHATQAQPTHAGKGHDTTSCLDCHMPRIVMGLDHYVRSHRISSPTNPQLLADAVPNACNLCHLDRTIDWTLTELRAGWDEKLAIRTEAYGDNNVGDVWLASKTAAIRLIAMQAYARSPLGQFVRTQIAHGLDDPQAYVRAWAKLSLDMLNAARSSPSHAPRPPSR